MVADEGLVPKFVQAYYSAQSAVDSGDADAAKKAYAELLSAYKQLNSSALAREHKELAHRQVKQVYDEISSQQEGVPDFLRKKISETPRVVNAKPVSIPIHPKTGGDFVSSFKTRDLAIGIFAVLMLFVILFKPSFVGLSVIEEQNTPPRWTGSTVFFKFSAGEFLALDLKKMFSDADSDELVFLVTQSDGLNIDIAGGTALLSASRPGTYKVVIIASDLESITKVPVTVRVS